VSEASRSVVRCESRRHLIHGSNAATRQQPTFPNQFVRKGLSLLSGIVLLALLLAGCAPKSKSTLVVGMELNYPPFEMIDPQGRPAGISVEMANELGKFIEKDVQIQNIPFDGLIPALKTGKIDLIISSMTETPQRAQSIDFSEPYLRTGLCLLVNKSAGIDSIEQADRANISVAVKQGTTGQLYAQQHLRNAHVLVFEKEDACVLEVVQNKAQAFIYDQMSIYKHWQLHQDGTKAILKPFQEEQWAVGLRSDEQSLKAQVNAFLVVFKRNGGFDKLGDEYLKDQKEQFRKLGIPFYF
jgi:polar amino acid transport system substrate-binding protein